MFDRRLLKIALVSVGLALSQGAAAELKLEGELLRQERLGFYYWGRNDLFTAVQYLRPLAERGHAPSQMRLGEMLYAAEEFTEAARLLEEALEGGEPRAAMTLAIIHEAGYLGKVDREAALAALKKAAEAGYLEAMLKLAHYYEAGLVGDPDHEQAVYWLEKAVEQGSSAALTRLAEAREKGELGLAKDEAMARSLREQAAEARKQELARIEEERKRNYELFRAIERDYLGGG